MVMGDRKRLKARVNGRKKSLLWLAGGVFLEGYIVSIRMWPSFGEGLEIPTPIRVYSGFELGQLPLPHRRPWNPQSLTRITWHGVDSRCVALWATASAP